MHFLFQISCNRSLEQSETLHVRKVNRGIMRETHTISFSIVKNLYRKFAILRISYGVVVVFVVKRGYKGLQEVCVLPVYARCASRNPLILLTKLDLKTLNLGTSSLPYPEGYISSIVAPGQPAISPTERFRLRKCWTRTFHPTLNAPRTLYHLELSTSSSMLSTGVAVLPCVQPPPLCSRLSDSIGVYLQIRNSQGAVQIAETH